MKSACYSLIETTTIKLLMRNMAFFIIQRYQISLLYSFKYIWIRSFTMAHPQEYQSGEDAEDFGVDDSADFGRPRVVVSRERGLGHRRRLVRKYNKAFWTFEEDELLIRKVEQIGSNHWALIAKQISGRSGKQCRERWYNHLRNGVKKNDWQLNEYWLLALGVRAYGHKWSTIAKHLPGRTDNTIKNQWNCKMKPYRPKFDKRIEDILTSPDTWSQLNKTEKKLLHKISESSQIRQVEDTNHQKWHSQYDAWIQRLIQLKLLEIQLLVSNPNQPHFDHVNQSGSNRPAFKHKQPAISAMKSSAKSTCPKNKTLRTPLHSQANKQNISSLCQNLQNRFLNQHKPPIDRTSQQNYYQQIFMQKSSPQPESDEIKLQQPEWVQDNQLLGFDDPDDHLYIEGGEEIFDDSDSNLMHGVLS